MKGVGSRDWCGVPNQMNWVLSVFNFKRLALIQ